MMIWTRRTTKWNCLFSRRRHDSASLGSQHRVGEQHDEMSVGDALEVQHSM